MGSRSTVSSPDDPREFFPVIRSRAVDCWKMKSDSSNPSGSYRRKMKFLMDVSFTDTCGSAEAYAASASFVLIVNRVTVPLPGSVGVSSSSTLPVKRKRSLMKTLYPLPGAISS